MVFQILLAIVQRGAILGQKLTAQLPAKRPQFWELQQEVVCLGLTMPQIPPKTAVERKKELAKFVSAGPICAMDPNSRLNIRP